MRVLKRSNGYYYLRRPGRADISLRCQDEGTAHRNVALILEEERKAKWPTITVGELAEAFLKHLEGRPSYGSYASLWKRLSGAFRDRRPDGIDSDSVDRFVGTLDLAEGSIRSCLRCLRTILHFGVKRGLCERASYIPITQQGGVRNVWLNKQEARRLLDACRSYHVRLALMVMMMTAQRKSAVMGLRWEDVDFESGLVRFEGGYSNKRRTTVPMNASLRAALQEARMIARTDYVFEWAGRRVKRIDEKVFRATVKRAGLHHVTQHDLRRSAARWMIEDGRAIEEVAQVLGHTSIETTRRVYARFGPDFLRAALAATDIFSNGPEAIRRKG